MKTRLSFDDFVLKLTAERTRSNLSVCGGVTLVFFENNT